MHFCNTPAELFYFNKTLEAIRFKFFSKPIISTWFTIRNVPCHKETNPLICTANPNRFLYDRDLSHERVNIKWVFLGNWFVLETGCLISSDLFDQMVLWFVLSWNIIRTGITCKKISSYMHDSACRWLAYCWKC